MTAGARLRSEAPAVLGLLALAAAQLWPAAGPGRLPESLDLMLQYVPNAAFLREALRSGGVPLWNPYLGAGMPFAADPGAGAWYLPSWPLLTALPLYAGVRVSLWLHLVWAAVGTYAFCRVSLGVGRLAAAVGAITFSLTAWLPGLTGMPAVLTAVAWLPWIVGLGLEAARRGGLWRTALAVAGALQLVSGWPVGAYLSWLTLGALYLLGRPEVRGALSLAASGAAAALLSGVLLVPAFEFLSETSYGETRPVEAAGGEAYLTLLAWLRPASGSGTLESSQLYVGLAALALSIAALVTGDRRARPFAILTLAALLVAMGTRTPLFGALYQWLPGFRIVYLPARLGIVATFSLAALAAIGLQRVADGALSRRHVAITGGALAALMPVALLQFWHSEGYDAFRLLLTNVGRFTGAPYLSRAQEAQYVAFGALSLAALATAPTRWRRYSAPALLALLVSDVLIAHQLAHPPTFDPTRWYAPAFETAERLRPALGAERVAGSQWHGTTHFLTDFPRSADASLLPPNLSQLVRLRDAQGYNPLLLRRAAEYFARLNARESALPDDHWLWVQDFAVPELHALAVSRVVADGAAWRARSIRAIGPTQVLAGGVRVAVPPLPGVATRLHLVSYLGEAVALRDGTAVGELRVADGGGTHTFPLRAGVETAEWAYGRADVAQRVAHRQAPIALRTQLVDPTEGRFPVYEYRATFDLSPGAPPSAIEVGSLLPASGPTSLNVAGVWLEVPGSYPEAGAALRNVSALPRLRASAGSARITHETNERVEATAESASGTSITLADAIYPGWVARVDGQPVQIVPEDDLFRRVDVPAGRHTLVFSYEPVSLRWGAALSAVGLASTAALAWRRSRPSTTSSSVRRNTSRPKRLARLAARAERR